ncbi:diguanylate cyclase (GGDEF)-like protein/PAS domain S-box-containing protein [Novosphingobium chloroacetimidivorans]|uniref:Diguanylate cyclase (GGDEF)-like protein/PAS domain S-box-containing protein n=1 Tax=Novosphingobium chloroacetimidivorans TaxID=1428314 RepID=A0A7W7K8Y1_9SPHN|nr:GGDEF domain-containing phosphodiesterase [Novosphingobium chloroacetimidivorans]MBB4857703.1 diguanylate cyclase (GGDEF)-like protein/PAS domain S-box-containing protein [Novosphingobium chloroacetimidivorans]
MRELPEYDGEAPTPLEAEHASRLLAELERAAPSLARIAAQPEAALPLLFQDMIDALSQANVGFVYRALDGRILAANDFFCELMGRRREELADVTLEQYSHPDEIGPLLDLFREHVRDATPFHAERRFLRPDGTHTWCLVHVSFLCDGNGRPTGTIAVVLDDTIRRNAEAELRESEAHYRHSCELAAQIRWTAAPDGAILEVSSRWANVTGRSVREALGHGWMRALHKDDVATTCGAWEDVLVSMDPLDVSHRLRTADGTDRWFRARAAPRLDDAGKVVRWYGTLEDIDDRKRTEEALRESEERFRLAAKAAGLGIWDFDAVQDRREWSDDFKRMVGLPLDAEPDPAVALALVVPEDRQLLQELVDAVEVNDSEHRFEVVLRIRRADNGEERWMQTSGWRIDGPNGRLERVLVTIRDVTEQRNADERVRWTANHDALTGLPNRAYFNQHLETAIARAREHGETLALVIFDIDNFKEANDTIGHDGGDALLRAFSARLTAGIGERGFVARLGGDEFAAFVQVMDEKALSGLVLPSLQDVADHLECDAHGIACEATAGAALFPRDGFSTDELLKAADIALYAGKSAQRGTLTMFRPQLREPVQRRASMLATARNVIADERVMPFYQPKVRLADGRIAGFEALMRWRHDELGVLGPDRLWAAFEDFNLATALGERMLDGVCRDIARWREEGFDFGRVAVNLSPAEFRREDLFDRVMACLHRSRVAPSMLELEVTETVFMGRGADSVSDVLERFHREGISLALDDFGTGYASLTHLQAFPVDVIKIDRSFVTHLAPDSANAAIVDAIIGLAERLGMDVIAEGIEAAQEARYLRERGCGYGQGYLFGRAMAANAVLRLLAQPQRPSGELE